MTNQWQLKLGAMGVLHPSDGSLSCLVVEGWKEVNDQTLSEAYPAETELLRQGTLTQAVYLIDRGLIKLVQMEPDGRETVVGVRGPGWLLGATSVILQKPYPVTAVTLTRCHLRRVPADEFRYLLNTNSQFSWYVYRMHSREVPDRVEGFISARHRLEHLLWELVSAQDEIELQKPVRLRLPLKQWEVAKVIASKPASVSQLLNQLEEEGVLRRDEGWLIISDPDRLWHPMNS
jgi:CRP/FNR family transcriptional regulator